MKKSILIVLGALFIVPAFSAVETSLGAVKAVKITQKVEVADCQANYVRKETSAWCKVPVFTRQETDTVVSISQSVKAKIPQGDGAVLDVILTANVEGFYWFVFSKKSSDDFFMAAPTFDQVSPHLGGLIDQLDKGEVYWKLYRVHPAN